MVWTDKPARGSRASGIWVVAATLSVLFVLAHSIVQSQTQGLAHAAATTIPGPQTVTGTVPGSAIDYSITARVTGSDSEGWGAVVTTLLTNNGSWAENDIECNIVYSMGSNASWPESVGSGMQGWVQPGQTRSFADQNVALFPRGVVGGQRYAPGLSVLSCALLGQG